MKKFLSIVLTLVLITSIFVGCQQAPKEGDSNTPGDKDKALTIEDPAGNELTIPEEIDTIVSMAPSITEVLVELGLADKIIAVDNNSVGIEGLKEDLPIIEMMSPDVEQIIALKPDLILASTITMGGGDDPLTPIKDAGITIGYIPSSNSIEGIYKDIDFISKLLKIEDKGKEIVDSMKAKIDEFKAIGETITDKKSVYFEIGAAPNLYSFGKGVFLNEMIELIGAENILKETDGWVGPTEEEVIGANPDVILTNVNYVEDAVEEIKSREGWEGVTAIKENQVYYIDNSASSLPNQNIVKALEEMAKAIYPDKY